MLLLHRLLDPLFLLQLKKLLWLQLHKLLPVLKKQRVTLPNRLLQLDKLFLLLDRLFMLLDRPPPLDKQTS